MDSAFSSEPDELAELVAETERAWLSLGKVSYGPSEAERKSLVFRRSIYVAQDIAEGDLFSSENLRIVRPGDGAPPSLLNQIIGKKSNRAFAKGEPLSLEKLL